jgi:hypothetical protein
MPQTVCIESVGHLLEFLNGQEFDVFTNWLPPSGVLFTDPHNFHGIWFRGQSDESWSLEPGVFRQKDTYDEGSAAWHFMLTATEERSRCSTDFEWLCLMQHYGLPTRLLDWTQSALVALFFACEEIDKQSVDGSLFILNAQKLNFLDANRSRWASVLMPNSAAVALRSAMARSIDVAEFFAVLKGFDRRTVIDPFLIEQCSKERDLNYLNTAVAVFPYRSYPRMVVQHSVFTLHGGKAAQPKRIAGDLEPLPPPIPLAMLNEMFPEMGSFLIKLTVRADKKRRLLQELKLLGSTRSSLFPELEHQAAFLKERWTAHT